MLGQTETKRFGIDIVDFGSFVGWLFFKRIAGDKSSRTDGPGLSKIL